MKEREKLEHILHHWIEHNEAHVSEYKKWADIAAKEGLPEVRDSIMEALKRLEDADTYIKKAIKAFH